LSACGTRFALIAIHIGIDTKTLRRHFRRELSEGRQDANSRIAKSLFDAAIEGNTTAQIFWLKSRAGWRETQVVQNQVLDKYGNPVDQPKFGISFSDGGPGLPLLRKPTLIFDDVRHEESAENELNHTP
jgi:hypothetical protein